MIADLNSPNARTVTASLLPEEMVALMRDEHKIGIPIENVDVVADMLKPLLAEGERLGFNQSCDHMMDLYILPAE